MGKKLPFPKLTLQEDDMVVPKDRFRVTVLLIKAVGENEVIVFPHIPDTKLPDTLRGLSERGIPLDHGILIPPNNIAAVQYEKEEAEVPEGAVEIVEAEVLAET